MTAANSRPHPIPPSPSVQPDEPQIPPNIGVPAAAEPCHGTKSNGLTIFPIDHKHRLAADQHCWMIQRCKVRRERKGNNLMSEWKSISYHVTLENAVNALTELKLRTAGTQTIAEALAEVRNIGAMMVRALNPQYEVKERVE